MKNSKTNYIKKLILTYLVTLLILMTLVLVVPPTMAHDLHVYEEIDIDKKTLVLINETRITQTCLVFVDGKPSTKKVVIKAKEKSKVIVLTRIADGYGYICRPDQDGIQR